jgi:alanine racemase
MVGRVTMDFIMVDLGPHGGATLGDVAVIVGRDRGDEITIDEFASWSGTISYEALTRLGLRMEREYLGS